MASVGGARAHGAPDGAGAVVDRAAAAESGKRIIELRPGPHFGHLTTNDGLPQSHVTSIAQDRVGFLWFGTQEGLARYDGTGFEVYRHEVEGPSAIPSSYVTALVVDKNGALWIGTEAGLAVYDVHRDRFQTMGGSDESGGAAAAIVTALHADDRAMWVGYQDGALDRFDLDTRVATRIGLDVDVPIKAITAGKDGTLWVGTLGQGLLRLSPAGELVSHHRHGAGQPDSLPADLVNALLVSRDGTLWVGTESSGEGGGGLARSSGDGQYRSVAAGRGRDQLTDPRITFLLEDGAGQLWVGTKNGLNRLDPKAARTDRFEPDRTSPSSLSYSWLTSAYADRDGVLWIGTFASGIDKLIPGATELEFANVVDTPTAFCEATGDVLWIGTIPGALIRFDRQARRAEVWNKLPTLGGDVIDLTPHWITDIHRDKQGALWLAVLGLGLVQFDPETERAELFTGAANELAGQGGWRFAAGADGLLWIASWGNGLVRFDPRLRSFVRYTDENVPGMSSNLLYTIKVDNRDPTILWLGTAKGGLLRFDSVGGKAEAYRSVRDRPDTISNNDVLAIEQSRDGALWIGTYGGGLNRFDPGARKFERLSEKIGLSNDTIYGVLLDPSGALWLTTNGGGLARFDPKNGRVATFDGRDGLPDEYAQGGYYAGPSGRFYVGSAQGTAIWFRPERVVLDAAPPQAVLTSFRVYNRAPALDRPIWSAPPIDLGYRDTLLTFRLAALALASPKKIRYQYQLDQNGWVDLPGPVLTLNLPTYGDHELRVRAASGHGAWGQPSTPLAIHLATPLWRTWWAYGLYGAAVLFIGISIFRYQSRRLVRIERSMRFSAMERDLELTAAVQTGFLPRKSEMVADDLVLKGFYRPASTCSGDWWWYESNDERQHLILVGDVTGHGAGPAMVTAAVAAAFRVQRELGESVLERRLNAVNQEVLRVANGEYQMALTALSIDRTTGILTAYSAGGVPAIMVNGGKPETVPCRGTPLGTAAFQLGQTQRVLPPSARIFVSTDGLVEVEGHKGRRFGFRGLVDLIQRTSNLSVEDAVDAIAEQVTAVNGAALQMDDWTFLVADWRRLDHS